MPKKYTIDDVTAMKYPIPVDGKCLCGCGETTEIAPYSRIRYNWINGEHKPFYSNHKYYHERGVRYIVCPNTGCWLWQGFIDRDGYGVTGRRDGHSGTKATHIIFYEEKYGAVPEGLELDHRCNQRNCCNPDHVIPTTHIENIRRSANTKLTKEQAIEIMLSYGKCSARELASKYNVQPNCIKLVWKRKMWADVTSHLPTREEIRGRPLKSGAPKLTVDDVIAIKQRRQQGEMIVSLAKEFGVSIGHVSDIIHEKKRMQ